MEETKTTGAAVLVRALEAEGVDTVFGTVGHGNLAFVDALLDSESVRYVSVFHEQVAAHAADAYFRVSGRIAVVTTTVGPGFTNLATGLGDALLDSSALVVVAGGVPSAYVGRDPLQELGLHGEDGQTEIFRPLSKRVFRVQGADQLGRTFHRAVRCAVTDCPGPVIVHVPLDFFSALTEISQVAYQPTIPIRVGAEPAAVARAAEILVAAERPLVYAGGGAVLSRSGGAITRLAEEFGIPVATTMSGRGTLREDHPLAMGFTGVVGTRPANAAAKRADVLLAIGTRFPEMDASSWRPDFFAAIPPTKLIQIDLDPNQIDKIFPAACGLVGDATRTTEELALALRSQLDGAPEKWASWRAELEREKTAWNADLAEVRETPSFPYEPAYFLTELRKLLPKDAILVSGVGIRHLVGQHFPILTERSHVVASGFGTMGQEVAAPLGICAASPNKPTVALVGDGAVMACLAALPTAVAAGLHVVWLVLNNGGYASIAIYQSKHFGRFVGTRFETNDGEPYAINYAELACSFGVRGVRVESPQELPQLLERALGEPAPWVIEVPITPTPRTLASGHWDVNDILAAPGAGRSMTAVAAT
jgi:acetolactate synthase-1/2/3 large subunit